MKEMSPTHCINRRGSEQQSNNCYKANNNSRILKRHRVLAALCTGRSFTRFQAENLLHDYCLHSTVSEIQKRYEIVVNREVVTVRGFKGNPTKCMRYWIEETQLIDASMKLANELVYRGVYRDEKSAIYRMNELWQG